MTAWETLGAALGGGLVTGAAAIWGQVITHRGTNKREREARHDAFRVKRFEIERDTLIALQEALADHHGPFRNITRHMDSSPDDDQALQERLRDYDSLRVANGTVIQLNARVLDDGTRRAVSEYLRMAQDALIAGPTTSDAVTEAHNVAQRAIGAALRRDPFADDRE